ncbi:hypothetical protein LTS15_001673 [Exophiala xenobiotica]|nr:hypothetical protein LTS15_001673 [Exophiala xenobiotica]
MVDGVNCGFISPPRNLEHHTCTCGNGYMNDEGTLIPGSIIKEGYALAKSDYQGHKGCKRCEIDPLKCDWRRQHLLPRDRKSTITAPPNGIFEFFVNGEGISQEVLYEFLLKNNDGDITCLPDKRFKARPAGKTGFFVRSSFRFNTRDHNQLKELTHLLRQGRGWKSQLRRVSPVSNRPFNEFTRYMQSNRTTSFDEDLSQVTSRTSHMTVSGKYEEQSPRPSSYSRTSIDSRHNPRKRDDNTPEIRHSASSERSRPGDSTQRETEQSSMVGQMASRRSRFDRSQESDSFNDEDALGRSSAREDSHESGRVDDGRHGSAQLPSSRPGPARRSSTYHRDHGYQITSEASTLPRDSAAGSRLDPAKHLGHERKASDDKEQVQMKSPSWRRESYSSSNTSYVPGTQGYATPTTAYSTQSYNNSYANYGTTTTTGYSAHVAAYGTSPPAQASNPIFKDPIPNQDRPRTHDIQQTNDRPGMFSSHGRRGTSPEPHSGTPRSNRREANADDNEAYPVTKVKFHCPSTGIDEEMLAFYMKHCVDPKTRIERRPIKGRDGFVIEASRTITRDEIEDIIKDSRSWKRERESGRGKGGYPSSETAQRRKRAGGGR